MENHDIVIVGGGIIGLSAALAVTERRPGARVLVLEKEPGWAMHQTGHNSGVIHSGIYYRRGSLKATFAVEGNRLLREFCSRHGIPHEICGKVIVATSQRELPRLVELQNRGLDNGLEVHRLASHEIREVEPHVAGVAALFVPSAGIVDYRRVAEKFAELVAERGGELRRGVEVDAIDTTTDGVVVHARDESFRARFLINCAGLQSDRIAIMAGVSPGAAIVPFRGEYYELRPESRSLVRNLIYPVPDPAFPFLGVHFTRMIDGSVHAGPNAVLALKREGYDKRAVDLHDLAEMAGEAGLWRLALKHWKEGGREVIRSLSKSAFVRSLQRLIPDVRAEDLTPGGAGVRAQALARDGRLIEDFLLVRGRNSLHVCNAPSPAATASMPIGRAIAEQVLQQQPLPSRSTL